MRVQRFEPFARQLVADAGSDVLEVKTFSEAGYTAKLYGLALTATTGAKLLLQFVRTSPPGGDQMDEAETIVEGEAPAPVELPSLALAGAKLRVADVDQWLRALILNSGSREVQAVELFAEDQDRTDQKPGFRVCFHSGGVVFAQYVHTLPAGARLGEEYKVLEAV